MNNLYKYSDYIKEYYNRQHNGKKTRSESLTEEEFIKILKTNCSNFNPHKSGYLYRGANDTGDYVLIDPSKYSRGSIEGVDTHTFLMDNMPEWRDYPSRSKSVIASTDKNVARGYGAERYIVIPFNMSLIGICPEENIWLSFEYGPVVSSYNASIEGTGLYDYGYDSLFKTLYLFINNAGLELKMNSNKEYTIDYETFILFFKHEFKIDRLNPVYLENSEIINCIKFTLDIKDTKDITGDDVLKFIEMTFNPDLNKFKVAKYTNDFNIDTNDIGGNSVWIGDKCLLIKEKVFEQIKSKL